VNEDLPPSTSTLRRDGQRKLHASALDFAESLDRPHPPDTPPVQLIMSLALRRREAHSFFHSTSIPRPFGRHYWIGQTTDSREGRLGDGAGRVSERSFGAFPHV
jgi:hypothetical protein